MRRIPPVLVGTILALLALRMQLLQDLSLDLRAGLLAGIWVGAVADIGMVLALWGLANALTAVLRLPRKIGGSILLFLIVLAALGETLYFRFFHSPLYWWVVRDHLGDAFVARESATTLADSNWIIAAATVFLATLALWLLRHEKRRRSRVRILLAGLGWILAGLVIRQSPTWTPYYHPSLERNIMNSNLLVRWYDELTIPRAFARGTIARAKLDANWRETRANIQQSASRLAELRDGSPMATSATARAAAGAGGTGSEWPTLRRFETPATERRALRRALGLPEEGAIHVFFVFLESFREFEFRHPQLGDVAAPELRKLIAEHGIRFTQSYANAFTAAQTVRGQFASLCSMYPNPLGEAPYLNFPTLRISCMAEEFRRLGHSTNWFNSHVKEFNNKNVFEAVHGMDRFFDMHYFLSQGVKDVPHQPFGLRDRPFFDVTLAKIRELESTGGKPLFANILTTSTHHPPAFIEEGAIPAAIDSRLSKTGRIAYRNMLTQYRYSDAAAADFLRALLSDPAIGPRSLVVLLADHSHSLLPAEETGPVQRSELFFRIPTALLTASPKETRIFEEPIHQIDLAPMVAAIAGIDGRTTWQGRNPLRFDSKGRLVASAGSPWLYQDSQGRAQYRTADRLCLELDPVHGRKCYSTRDSRTGKPLDPLYWTDEDARRNELAAEDPRQLERFTQALQATRAVIEWDGLFPPRQDAAVEDKVAGGSR